MKNKYEYPEVEIVKFGEDIICTSNELPIRPFDITDLGM